MTDTSKSTRRYMKPKTWAKANLVREEYENRHEYRKAAAIGFNAYKQQQEAAKAAKAESAKPKPAPKQEEAPAKPVTKAEVMADLKKLTKAQLLQVVEFVLQAAPEPEAKPKAEAKPEPEAKPKAAKPKAEPKPKPAKTETKAESKASDGEILWARYSEKCVVLYGDTKPSKDAIKAVGGLWRPFMESPDGNRGVWLLSNKAFEKFQSISK